MDLSLTSGIDNYETLKQFESRINRKQNGVFSDKFNICDKFSQISCTPRKLFHIKFSNFFWKVLFSSSAISLIFHLYSTLVCNSKHMCKTIFKCTFYTFFFFKYHNQKLQFKGFVMKTYYCVKIFTIYMIIWRQIY